MNRTGRAVPLAYMAAILLAEFIFAWVAVFPGILCHAVLIFVLLSHYAFQPSAVYARVLPALALLPLLRLLSIATPTRDLLPIFWYFLAGIPLLAAVGFAARLLRLSRRDVYLGMPSLRQQILVALCGIPLALAARFFLPSHPVMDTHSLPLLLVGTGVAAVFVALTEELVFRGVLQRVLSETPEQWGLLAVNPLYAALMMSSFSWQLVLFAGVSGVFFSTCVQRTGSLWGVIIAHAMVNFVLLI